MKKGVLILCICFMVVFSSIPAFAVSLVNVNLNGQYTSTLLEKADDGEYMIPFIEIVELLNCKPFFDKANNIEGIYNDNISVFFSVGSTVYSTGSSTTGTQTKYFTTPPIYIDNLIYVPAKDIISGVFGYSCDITDSEIVISSPSNTENINTDNNSTDNLNNSISNNSLKSNLLYLYSNDGKTFLGSLSTNEFDSDSIWNEFGTYGSKYSSKSIWNEFGTYGSKYSSESAFNDFALTPPIIVDGNGNFVGYLTSNTSKPNGYTIYEIQTLLKQAQ
ncbi:MAG: hypothetical protein LKJ25_04245 [Clostridia bacterium]|jgi:hypothetical protein|nr:hypothetical protein [Clostridia bacterium]